MSAVPGQTGGLLTWNKVNAVRAALAPSNSLHNLYAAFFMYAVASTGYRLRAVFSAFWLAAACVQRSSKFLPYHRRRLHAPASQHPLQQNLSGLACD